MPDGQEDHLLSKWILNKYTYILLLLFCLAFFCINRKIPWNILNQSFKKKKNHSEVELDYLNKGQVKKHIEYYSGHHARNFTSSAARKILVFSQ